MFKFFIIHSQTWLPNDIGQAYHSVPVGIQLLLNVVKDVKPLGYLALAEFTQGHLLHICRGNGTEYNVRLLYINLI